MAILKVNPTRINLLNLKKDLKTAQKGYNLLKDKSDGLMKKFMEVIQETKDLRSKVEKDLSKAFNSYLRASGAMSQKAMDSALMLPNTKIELEVSTHSIMSVLIPSFKINKEGNAFSYGFLETSGDLDNAILKFDKVFPDLVRLAELEKTVENLAEEIEKTRRRVSALENTMIPNLKETIRFIYMRLEEQARDAVVSTMRIKAMIVEREEAKALN
jgi:V/A-type H+/Na+-transporting ATPase subunit D